MKGGEEDMEEKTFLTVDEVADILSVSKSKAYEIVTSEVDTDTMNRAVSKMVEEALKYNQVESVLESGEEEDIFSPEYFMLESEWLICLLD